VTGKLKQGEKRDQFLREGRGGENCQGRGRQTKKKSGTSQFIGGKGARTSMEKEGKPWRQEGGGKERVVFLTEKGGSSCWLLSILSGHSSMGCTRCVARVQKKWGEEELAGKDI